MARAKPVTTDLSDLRVTLKVATSLDGKIATHSGHSQWITGPEARKEVHRLRSQHDAVLTGIGTVLADDPQMNVRGIESVVSQPQRVVLDSRLRTPLEAKLLSAEGGPLTIFVNESLVDADRIAQFRDKGVQVIAVSGAAEGRPGLSLPEVCHQLAQLGVSNLMIEAGAGIAGSFLSSDMVDRLEWFKAPMIIGGDGLSVFGALGVSSLSDASRFKRTGVRAVGDDLWETYERQD